MMLTNCHTITILTFKGGFPASFSWSWAEVIKLLCKNYLESCRTYGQEIDSLEAKNILKFHAWLFIRVKPVDYETFFKFKLSLWYFSLLKKYIIIYFAWKSFLGHQKIKSGFLHPGERVLLVPSKVYSGSNKFLL